MPILNNLEDMTGFRSTLIKKLCETRDDDPLEADFYAGLLQFITADGLEEQYS